MIQFAHLQFYTRVFIDKTDSCVYTIYTDITLAPLNQCSVNIDCLVTTVHIHHVPYL